ncbi:MAG: YncE family protein [Steroidobacteraceae bacterium]
MNRLKLCTALTVLSMALATIPGWAVAQRSRELLVVEKGNAERLAIVDPVRLEVLARIPAGSDPHEVIASSDGTRAYVSNYGGSGSSLHTITVVNLLTRKALPPIDVTPLHSVHGLDFAGGELYFTAETNKVIGRYNPATHRVDWIMGTGQVRSHMIMVGSSLHHIFVSNPGSGTISIFQQASLPAGGPGSAARTEWTLTNVPARQGSEGFDVSPDGRQLWTANAGDDSVTVVDVATEKALETFPIPVHGANRLKFTPDGRYVLVSGLGDRGATSVGSPNNLVILSARTHRVVKRLDLGAGAAGIIMDPAGHRAFVAVSGGNELAVIDLEAFRVRGVIKGLEAPDGMAWALVPRG